MELSLPLTRDGGLILADNTLSHSVLDSQTNSSINRYNTAVSAHPDLASIIVPVLRGRGIDGLLLSIKRRPNPEIDDGDLTNHAHNIYRAPTNEYGAAWTVW